MKKNVFINVLRVVFCIIFFLILAFVCNHPPENQTNILNAILSDSPQDELLVNMSQKHSGRFNVIFESEDIDSIETVQKKFLKLSDSSAFRKDFSSGAEISELLNTYKYYNRNLLSINTERNIVDGNLELLKLESLERLYNPLGINLLPIEEDPFMLFSDFLSMLESPYAGELTELDGKYYAVSKFNFKEEIALSPSLLNTEMKKIIKARNKLVKENNNVNIYITGSPIHTFYASSKSMKEINIICVLSALFIILICKFYFRSYKILIPVFVSLALGMLFGYLLTSLFFKSIHILTFVFSTTLIGICVDYSLHYFSHDKDISKILKSLTMSMLTTVSAFLVLLFSNMELLRQIAVFTAGGLVFVYLFVILFYPVLCKKIETDTINLDLSFYLHPIAPKYKKIIVSLLILVIVIGFFKLKFNDEIKDMYRPPQNLANAEKLYSTLNKTSETPTFFIVKGNDNQDLLEKEEAITHLLNQKDFFALSKFVPSIKQQKRNRELINYLYNSELDSYASFLPAAKRNEIKKQKPRRGFITIENIKIPIINDFLLQDRVSVIIMMTQPSRDFVAKVKSENPSVEFVDLKKDISDKVRTCRESCLKLIIPAILVLLILLSIIYKPKNAVKLIMPSVLSGVVVIGVLSFFNQDINFFHILALFLIVGFSLDYSIFRFNFVKESSSLRIKSNWAVLISCATTVFSFFLLSMTSFKLISSLGLILSLGLISSYILSILLISPQEESEIASDNI